MNKKTKDTIKEIRKYIGHKTLLYPCATALIINNNNEVLLELRSDDNKYGYIGGMIEVDENIIDALKREIKEELDADEELNSKFDAALTVMGYLLRGYEVDEIDSELENLIKEILIEGGADGETLEELVNNMRVKIDSLNGGNALKKD